MTLSSFEESCDAIGILGAPIKVYGNAASNVLIVQLIWSHFTDLSIPSTKISDSSQSRYSLHFTSQPQADEPTPPHIVPAEILSGLDVVKVRHQSPGMSHLSRSKEQSITLGQLVRGAPTLMWSWAFIWLVCLEIGGQCLHSQSVTKWWVCVRAYTHVSKWWSELPAPCAIKPMTKCGSLWLPVYFPRCLIHRVPLKPWKPTPPPHPPSISQQVGKINFEKEGSRSTSSQRLHVLRWPMTEADQAGRKPLPPLTAATGPHALNYGSCPLTACDGAENIFPSLWLWPINHHINHATTGSCLPGNTGVAHLNKCEYFTNSTMKRSCVLNSRPNDRLTKLRTTLWNGPLPSDT